MRNKAPTRKKQKPIDWQPAIRAWQVGDREPMRRLCQQVLAIDPAHPVACANMGAILANKGRFTEAIALYERGLQRAPRDATLNINLARSLCETRQWARAYAVGRLATELAPRDANAQLNFSWACNMVGKPGEGEIAARQALALASDDGYPALMNLGTALKEQGRLAEAVAVWEQAVARRPRDYMAYLNLLLGLLYLPGAQIGHIVDLARRAGGIFDAQNGATFEYDNAPDPFRRLRLGLISPDFSDHSVMYFVEPLLTRLDRRQFEVVWSWCIIRPRVTIHAY